MLQGGRKSAHETLSSGKKNSPSSKPKRHPVPRPFLKWAGGKQQLLPYLLDNSPSRFKKYYEPFAGGAALFFALFREGRLDGRPAFLADINRELMTVYTAVREDVREVIKKLRRYRYDSDYYYKVRKRDPWKLPPPRLAARMIFLNRTGYNGLYRVNSKGQFNVPFGRYKNPIICDSENLRAVSDALQKTELLCQPFEAVLKQARKGDFVYFDPPYVPLSTTAYFVSYAQDGFNLVDQERLAQVFRKLAKRGVFVMLSNSDTEWVREHYEGFRLVEVKVKRSVNSKGDSRGAVGELIVLSYDPEEVV